MIIMSVDYGDVRTGLAICDKTETLATPIGMLKAYNDEKLIELIKEKINQYKPELIVIGLPKNMDSTEGERASKCRMFAEKLSDETKIPFIMRDERLTTVSAYTSLNMSNIRGNKRKEAVDQIAATIILQDYLDSKK